MAILEPTMFREYDLRGRISDEELNEDTVLIISKAYGTMLRRRDIDVVVVGYDLRRGSKELSQVAVEGLISTGLRVIFIGQVLSPILYHAQYHFNSKGGMMVTASHNPNGWLGFKLALGFSYTLGPEEMGELRNLTISEDFSTGVGTFIEEDYIPIYAADVLSRVNIARPIKILINSGNGTAGPIAPPIFREAGCEVFEFLSEPDLEFSHYFPNPSKEEMMNDTGHYTVQSGADIGLAFDGDGDRLGVTDEKGQIVWPDRYLALLGRKILEQSPGETIIFDMKCSRALGEDILAHGGKPYMWRTGHSYIKEKLHELDAPLAGEMSGHIFFGKPNYYGFDDAVFTGLKLVELLSQGDASFSELVSDTPNYISTPTLQTHCDDEAKYDVVAQLVDGFKNDGYEVVIFDNDPRFGGRVEFDDGWALVRASSNLPVLTMRFEATTNEKLEELIALFKERMSKYPQIGDVWESG